MSGSRAQDARDNTRIARDRAARAKWAAGQRDPGQFIALPYSVLDCTAYRALSHAARSLLIEMARQLSGSNNGRLLASMNYLRQRGWGSADVVSRAKKALLEAGFIHETVKGHRPNRASWYAVTWHHLHPNRNYDPGATETFRRGAYRDKDALKPKPTRQELYDKWPRMPAKSTPLSITSHAESGPVPSAGIVGAVSAECSRAPDGAECFVAAPSLDGRVAPMGPDHTRRPPAQTKFGTLLRRVPHWKTDISRCVCGTTD